MHPLLASPRRLALYLAAWIPVAAALHTMLTAAGMDSAFGPLPAAGMALLYAFIVLSAYYSCRLAPLPSSSVWRVLAVQATAAMLSALLWIALSAALFAIVQQGLERPGPLAALGVAVPALFTLGVLVFALSAALHYLALAVERSRQAERRAFELQVVAREAELKTLRAQIDPHFLFNCLHSISALTVADPAAARRMCVLLGDFLRTSLRVGQRSRITLGEELALMRGYLAIEQVRLGPRLKVEEQVAPDAGDVHVPPLLLHPLIENAITHGIGHVLEGGRLALQVDLDGHDRVRISVSNTCDPDRPRRSGAGVGLENVRRRLATVYGHEAGLRVREQPDRFEAEMILPARRGGAGANRANGADAAPKEVAT